MMMKKAGKKLALVLAAGTLLLSVFLPDLGLLLIQPIQYGRPFLFGMLLVYQSILSLIRKRRQIFFDTPQRLC